MSSKLIVQAINAGCVTARDLAQFKKALKDNKCQK